MIRFLIQKEFLQIFRNRTLLPIIFVLPLVQLLILVNAATQEMKNISAIIVDQDQSEITRQLISKFDASRFFDVREVVTDSQPALEAFKSGEASIVIVFGAHSERDLLRDKAVNVQIIANAINTTQSQLGYAYASALIGSYIKSMNAEPSMNQSVNMIQTTSRYWFNPELNYKYYMLPGILVILVTIIGMFLSALNLVREKEMGTMEQINVTPVKKYQFILAKLIPFWIIGMFELALGLLLGKLVYDIPLEGNLWVLFAFTAIYLVAVLGLGLFISTTANSQQQVMFISFFFILVFVMMSGIFTPYENMPVWAQVVDYVNPLYYFMSVIRMILLKGSGLMDILPYFAGITLLALVVFPLSVMNYRKTT